MSPEPSPSATKQGHEPSLTFGPVPSRRLGSSLGINNIPPKRCSYSCAYCQVGRTPRTEIEPRGFYSPLTILEAVSGHLDRVRAADRAVDFLTFVPDGEPTLDRRLGESITRLRGLEVPVAVISNGSLCWRERVREALGMADWVSVKVDSVVDATWRRINRPHEGLDLRTVLGGLERFADEFEGELVTETMLVDHLNDGADEIDALAGYLARLNPTVAFVAVPTRPPAEEWVRPASEEAINRAYQILSRGLPSVEYLVGYEGDAFASTGDPERDLLAITAVHPMREAAVTRFIERTGASRELVERLVSRGDLERVEFGGRSFYVRRPRKERA